MHFTGLTFRPPYEANSLLLQVTTGCSHNRCSFCAMYRNVKFDVSPMDEIEADLREVATYYPESPKRVFLCNGDAFTLPAHKLEQIATMIHNYLPNVKTIGCYASVNNIRTKTDKELARLAQLGYSDLNIGIESALDDVLDYMNKGYTSQVARQHLLRLKQAGIPFNINIINGAAGPKRMEEHARANAQFLNDVQPNLLFVSPLHIDPGTPLEEAAAKGEFQECSLGEYIVEEMELLRGMEMQDCIFFGMHVSNPVAVLGNLPQDKDRLLAEMQEGMDEYTQAELDSHPYKGAEGRIIS